MGSRLKVTEGDYQDLVGDLATVSKEQGAALDQIAFAIHEYRRRFDRQQGRGQVVANKVDALAAIAVARSIEMLILDRE